MLFGLDNSTSAQAPAAEAASPSAAEQGGSQLSASSHAFGNLLESSHASPVKNDTIFGKDEGDDKEEQDPTYF